MPSVLSTLVVVSLLLASLGQAQSTDGDPTYGFGVSFTGGPNFTVPITLSTLRIEPEFGFTRLSTSFEENDDLSTSTLRLGTGVFTTNTYGDAMLHLGGRIGITRNSETEGGTSVTTTDLFLGPAAGGEYYLSDQFSLGAEVGLFYTNIGTPTDNVSRSMIRRKPLRTRANTSNEEAIDSPARKTVCGPTE